MKGVLGMEHEPETCRLDRRKKAIIAAARQLFVEQGYERTTLGQIVAHAGGSLATVYKLFGNKDRLLEAVVFENAESGGALIREASSAHVSPAATLHRIAAGLHEQFLDSKVVALVRIVISRSIRDQQFAHQFFERTAYRTQDQIEELFASWQSNGVTMNGSPAFLAEMFMGLLASDVHIVAISHGARVNFHPERLRARTDFFIDAAGLGTAN